MATKKQLGLIGSLVMFIGVFLPVVSVPMVGNLNYFQNGNGDGVFIIGLAGISLIFVLTEKFNWLFLTGITSLCIITYTITNLMGRISLAKSEMEKNLLENPFRDIADIAMQSMQIQWGWAVLIIAVGFIIASAAIESDSK